MPDRMALGPPAIAATGPVLEAELLGRSVCSGLIFAIDSKLPSGELWASLWIRGKCV